MPFPVIIPDVLPIEFPVASTPARRQLFPLQLNDQLLQPWARTSKHAMVQRAKRMRRIAFFMSCIQTSYQIIHRNSKMRHSLYIQKSIDFYVLYFTTYHLILHLQIIHLQIHPNHHQNFLTQIHLLHVTKDCFTLISGWKFFHRQILTRNNQV